MRNGIYNNGQVRAKKHLGQHFLRDEGIAKQIVDSLQLTDRYKQVLEVGPGMGVLTKYLITNTNYTTAVIEIDTESIAYLEKNYPQLTGKIITGDFLRCDLSTLFNAPFAVIGNFPYNISSQILFKVLDFRDHVPEVVGMFQREVALRIASPPGNKTYGILSVLLQAYYDIEYLFTVSELVFDPPPKVKSGVLRLKRNGVSKLDCDEVLFKQVVKAGFNQRRKTLRNALKTMVASRAGNTIDLTHYYFDKRAEQLSVSDFVELTRMISNAL